MSGERERLQLLRQATQDMVDGLPSWDGKSPAVLVTYTDPVTQTRLGHWFVPATAAPKPLSKPAGRTRHLRAVPDAS